MSLARFALHPSPPSFLAAWIGWLRRLWGRLDANRFLGLAAEMAFWLFLSLLPLAAAVGLIAAKLALGNWSQVAPIVDSLPAATQQMLEKQLVEMAAWNGGKSGIGAGLMFVWLASSGIHSIFDGLELESDAAPRPWWKKRVLAICACVALSVGVAVLALLGAGVGWLWKYGGGPALSTALQLESSTVGRLARAVLGVGISIGMVTGLYALALPHATRRSMPLLPGALLAVGLQAVVSFGYGFFLDKVGDSGAYQAGLASIGVTLMALFLFCAALLVGIEVNQILGERRALLRGEHHRARPA